VLSGGTIGFSGTEFVLPGGTAFGAAVTSEGE
jgi:hypothetical protein